MRIYFTASIVGIAYIHNIRRKHSIYLVAAHSEYQHITLIYRPVLPCFWQALARLDNQIVTLFSHIDLVES